MKLKTRQFFFSEGDIRDKKAFIDDFFVEEADIIFHLAAVVGVKKYMEDPILLIDTTIIGTRHILERCISHDVRILFASTSEVYGK